MAKDSILFSVKKKNSEGAPSYLLGTMHLPYSYFGEFPSFLQPLIQSCPLYASELDFAQLAEDENSAQETASQANPNPSLSESFGPAQRRNLQFWIQKKLNIPSILFDRLSPFQLSMLLQDNSSHSNDADYHPEEPVFDRYLRDLADKMGRQTFGLESLAQQKAVISELTYQDELLMLKQTVQEFSSAYKKSANVQNLLSAYKKGDSTTLYKKVKNQLHGLRKHFIYHRNERMAQKMIELMDFAPTFAAAGASHLRGGHGMIHILTNSGYHIKPIPVPAEVFHPNNTHQ